MFTKSSGFFILFVIACVSSVQGNRFGFTAASSSEGLVPPSVSETNIFRSSDPPASQSPATAPATLARPTVGAFYYCWFKDDGFHWEATKGRPLIGNVAGFYDSGDMDAMRQHIAWAKEYGINFWLLSYWEIENEAYQWENLRLKIQTIEETGFSYAILLEPDPDVFALLERFENGSLSLDRYLNEATNWFLNRIDILDINHNFLSSPAYLREADGRQILGFFHWDSPDRTVEILNRALNVRPELSERFWFWYFGGHGAQNHTSEIRSVLFPNWGAWAPYVPIAEEGWERTLDLYKRLTSEGDKRIITVAPSFNNEGLVENPTIFPRDGGARFAYYLETLKQLPLLPNYVLITSWNEWQEDSIIEPDLTEPNPFVYLEILRNWLSRFE